MQEQRGKSGMTLYHACVYDLFKIENEHGYLVLWKNSTAV
ncbi:hypothetical protein AGMMS49942_29570 [Spirochaetia bacterium]|nr:hypothetical protein AGMMS49942_29570 [Spirochaetia bacterium]